MAIEKFGRDDGLLEQPIGENTERFAKDLRSSIRIGVVLLERFKIHSKAQCLRQNRALRFSFLIWAITKLQSTVNNQPLNRVVETNFTVF